MKKVLKGTTYDLSKFIL